MNLLLIGGSSFLGRAYVSEALRRGHRVTTFNRGRSGPDQDGVEAVRGDRNSPEDLARLVEGRHWDAVVDTAGQQPYAVALAARTLRGHTDHYTFVSSVHAFTDWPALPVDEDSATQPCPADTPADQPPGNHLKAGCERAVLAAFGPERALILNCGLLIGPYENVGRLPWWLERIAEGGRVLAPGDPARATQLIDARDFAAFGLDLLERGGTGRYVTTAPAGSSTMRELLEACVAATGSGAELVWAPDALLGEAEVAPWVELPLWSPSTPEWSGIWAADTAKATAAGLQIRPLAETVADTWAWIQQRGPAGAPYRQGTTELGIDRAKEERLLTGL
ncbi:NAD-dependent epimerase/dehydratase family protein [Kitasatospora sp. NPDC002040]|uniref:NAD-dependent epimerase/dehydratase family protein n=1 Tax=Kitasatospora sp. NPDC002040 TaxID=3154661 RepID=UPI0033349415